MKIAHKTNWTKKLHCSYISNKPIFLYAIETIEARQQKPLKPSKPGSKSQAMLGSKNLILDKNLNTARNGQICNKINQFP